MNWKVKWIQACRTVENNWKTILFIFILIFQKIKKKPYNTDAIIFNNIIRNSNNMQQKQHMNQISRR